MLLKKAQRVIHTEAKAIEALAERIDEDFLRAVECIASCPGRVVVSGMGKTGIIGRKIAATLSSTGTPSIWMHSAEAVHGDLGQMTSQDVLILISHSGETEETKRLLPLAKKIGVTVIALTGSRNSSLGKHSDMVLDVHVKEEGCPLGLAPMASTTATLVMGDALAACLIVRKKFRKEDFAFFHPGGSLGRRLLLKVEDVMRKGTSFAKVKETAPIKKVLLAITRARCGSACVLDAQGHFVGVFTDGDLRRHIENDANLLNRQAKEVMTTNPVTIEKDRLATEALKILREKRIDELPVVDGNKRLVGLLDIQDLLKAGLV